MIAALARALLFAAILLIVGASAFRWLILGARRPDGHAVAVARRAGLLACALGALALAVLFAAQLAAFHDATEPLLSDAALLLDLSWGRAWLAQAGLVGLAAVGLALARRSVMGGWLAAAVAAVALAFTPAFAGHAIGSEVWTGVAVLADGLHVLAGGVWIGTMVLLGAGLRRMPAPHAGSTLLARLRSFSPLALICAAAIAVTGTFAVWLHLTAVSDLWRTSYGRWLGLKLALFLGILVFGAFNWKRATPALAATGDAERMRRSIRNELIMAALLLLVTAIFVASPLPGEG